MKLEVLELGTIVEDTISQTKGMLTHRVVTSGPQIEYIYQPSGLNPKTGIPVKTIWLPKGRIIGGVVETLDIPIDLIGTEAEDIATGYKGLIAGLTYHIGNCLHVSIATPGICKDTGAVYDSLECDIRRVRGQKITEMNKPERKAAQIKTPSPMAYEKKQSKY